MSEEQKNIAETVRNLVLELGEVEHVNFASDNQTPDLIVIPAGKSVHNLEQYIAPLLPRPRRLRGMSAHMTLESLIGVTNRFKDENSVLYASGDMKNPSLLTVFNYNEARQDTDGVVNDGAGPRHGDHRAHYKFPLSNEWEEWRLQNGKVLGQQEFAEFIENRIVDVLPPVDAGHSSYEKVRDVLSKIGGTIADPAKLMELSRGLAVHVDEVVKNVVNIASGEAQVQFETAHHDGQGKPLTVPSMFLIGIPVFQNGPAYLIAVRLRYRRAGGVIKWFYEMFQAERAFEDAYNEACSRAAAETGLPLFFGSPES
jgi:hypothetical protein